MNADILLIREVSYSIKDIRKNKLDYFLLFFQIVVLSDLVVHFLTDSFLIINFILTLFFTVKKGRVKLKQYFIFVYVFLSVALLPSLIWGFNFEQYLGYLLRISTAYFMINFYGDSFIPKFENIVFICAYLSLVFFLIQQISTEIFDLVNPVSRILLNPDNQAAGKRYFLIYFMRGDYSFRNSGVMWEPAAFGGLLAWGIIFNLTINRFSIDKKLITMFIACITTFSIGTYLYLFIIVMAYAFQRNIKIMYLIILVLPLMYGILQLPIVRYNLQLMQLKVDREEIRYDEGYDNNYGTRNVSRVGGFYINGKYFMKWPFGYGFPKRQSGELANLGVSPNGLMKIVVQWGIAGVAILIYSMVSLIKYLKKKYFNELKTISSLVLIFAMFAPFTGNPFSRQPLTFVILLIGIYISKISIIQQPSHAVR